MSNQETKELEGEIESARQVLDNQQVPMVRTKASDLPMLIVNGVDSPRSRIGKGLESIGGMTAETLHRISTAVGGVVKSPVVLMAKVGGLASPRVVTPTAPPKSSLEERVHHLEIQGMETERMLEKHVQIPEDCVNERMEGFEKALSSIQSRLDHVEFSMHESVSGFECQESVSGEPQYYDAEQQSDNFEALEAAEQNFVGAHGVHGEATKGSPILEKSHVKNDGFLEPQVVSTPVYSKEAFLTLPMKSTTPSSESAESVHRIDANNLPESSDQQLATGGTPWRNIGGTLQELHGSFVTESSAAAASSKFLEIARAVTSKKSNLAHTPSKLQSESVLEEPREAFPGEPSATIPVAKFEEYAQEDAINKSGTTIAAQESPLPPTFDATKKTFMKDPLATVTNAKLAQELAIEGVVVIALTSSEPPVGKDVGKDATMTTPAESPLPTSHDSFHEEYEEEFLASAPSSGPIHERSLQEDSGAISDKALASSGPQVSAGFEEPAHEDADKGATMTAPAESPLPTSHDGPHEGFEEESLESAPSSGPIHERSLQEDSDATSDRAVASSAPQVTADFEESTREDVGKDVTRTAPAESPLPTSHDGPHEDFEEESLASAPRSGPIHERSLQEDSDATSDRAVASSALQVTADIEESTREDVGEDVTKTAPTESPLPTSHDGPHEDLEQEYLASTPSSGPIHERSSQEDPGATSDKALASFGPEVTADFEESTREDVGKDASKTAPAESPLPTSHDGSHEDFEEESLATTASNGSIHERSLQEDSGATSDRAVASSEPQLSAGFEEPTREDVGKDASKTAPAESPLLTSHDGSHEDLEQESLASAPSSGPIHERSLQEDSCAMSDKALVSSGPQVSADSEEPLQEDVGKDATMTAPAESSLPTSHDGPHEDFEDESLAGAPSKGPIHEPSSQEDSGATVDRVFASSAPQVTVDFEESTREDVGKIAMKTAPAESPLPTSHDSSHDDFEEDSLASAPSSGPFHEPPSQENLNATSDRALASSGPQVSTDLEEPTREDVGKDATKTAPAESPLPTSDDGSHEDLEQESLASAPSGGPIHERSLQEDSGPMSDKALASSEPQVSAGFEEPAHEDADKGATMTAPAESPLPTSHDGPHEDFEQEYLASAPSSGPIHERSLQEDSGATSDRAVASSAPQVTADFEESTREDAGNDVTKTAPTESPLPTSHDGSYEDLEQESLASAPSSGPIHERSLQEESGATSDKALASSGPQVSAGFEEPAHEDADKGATMTAPAESPLPTSHDGPHEGFEQESLASAPSSGPIHERSLQEDSGATSPIHERSLQEDSGAMSDRAVASSAPQVTADFEESTREDVGKDVTKTTPVEFPLPTSHDGPYEDLEQESLASAPSSGPIHERSLQEDSGPMSDKALASSTPQVSAGFEEPAHEDVGEDVTKTAPTELPLPTSHDGPHEGFEQESLASAPSSGPIHERSLQEDSGATRPIHKRSLQQDSGPMSDKALASSGPQVSAGFEELAHEDADKGATMTAPAESPLPTSHDGPHEDFEQEYLASAPSSGPIHERSLQEDSDATSDRAVSSSAPQVTADIEESTREDVGKDATKTAPAESPLPTSHDGLHEGFGQESLASAPSSGPIHERSLQEDSDATSDRAVSSSAAQVTADIEESTREDVGKDATKTAPAKSPLPTSRDGSYEDLEQESLASAPTSGPIHERSLQEDSGPMSDKALASSGPQVSAGFEELAHEDADNGATMTAPAESPLPTSHDGPHEDFEQEYLASAPSSGPIHERSLQEDSDATSDRAVASSAPQVTADFEESTREDVGKDVTRTAPAESPLPTSHDGPHEDFEEESLASAPRSGPIHERSLQEDSGATSDKALASSGPQVSAGFEEPAHEDADKGATMTAPTESPLPTSHDGPHEGFEQESLASVPTSGPIHERSLQEDSGAMSDRAVASSAPQVTADFEESTHEDVGKDATKTAPAESPLPTSHDGPHEGFEQESLASVPTSGPIHECSLQEDSGPMSDKALACSGPQVSAGFEELAHEDADKGATMTAPAESPLPTSHDGPHEDFEQESLASAPRSGPIHERSLQEDSDATSDRAVSSSVPQVTADIEESTREDVGKDATKTAPAESPLPTSRDGSYEDLEQEYLASAPSSGPIHGRSLQEDSGATSDKALTSSGPQVSAGFEELAHEDADKGATMTAPAESPLPTSHDGPHEDFEDESLAGAPSKGPIHEPSLQEDSDATSDRAVASSAPQVTADFEESTREDVGKDVTKTAPTESPLPTSHDGPHKDLEQEYLASTPSSGPIHERSSQEDLGATSDKALASFGPEVTADFEESTREDVGKDASKTAPAGSPLPISHDGPHEDFEEEPLAGVPSSGPIHEPSLQDNSNATSDRAVASSGPQVSAGFKELAHEDADKGATMTPRVESPLPTSHDGPHEDLEEESLADSSSRGPINQPSSQVDSGATADKALASSESQVRAGFEEPTREDCGKGATMTAFADSPLPTSHDGFHEDFEEDSLASAPSSGPIHEPSSQDDLNATSDRGLASSKPQVASMFMEEPSSTILSTKFRERAHDKDAIKSDTMSAGADSPLASSFEDAQEEFDRSSPINAIVESPLVASLEARKEEYTKESLAAEANTKVLEPPKEDVSGKSRIAFASSETPTASFFGIPQGASLKEPLRTSIQPKERAEEKSGIVLPGADSTLTSTMDEDKHATMESKYKLAEDFKVHHERIEGIGKEFPWSQSNLAHVGSDESLSTKDNDDRLESDQSSEEFFDAEYDSGNLESWESNEPKSFKEFGVGPDEPGEAMGINLVAQKETLVPASSVEPTQELEQAPIRELAREPEQTLVQELEQQLDQAPTREREQTLVQELEQQLDQAPAREREQDHESNKQAHAQEHTQQPTQEQEQHVYGQQLAQEHEQHRDQEPKRRPTQEHGQETREELEQATEQELGQKLTHEREQEPEQQFEQQPVQGPEQEDLTRNSAMVLPPLELQVTSKSGESQELLAEESLAAIPSIKFEEPPQANAANESGIHDLLLTSTSEEPQNDTVVSPEKSLSSASFQQSGNPKLLENLKHKSLDTPNTSSSPKEALEREPSTTTPITEIVQEHEESPLTSTTEEPQNGSENSRTEGKHVKFIAEPIEEVIPRTQSDLTHVELNSKAAKDTTKLQSQGSFLAFGTKSIDSKNALAKEPLPSAKLLELFEEENNSRKRGPVHTDSLKTSTVEEPQKPLAKGPLSSAKSVPKSHSRWRGFARSSSEPQFAYKLEEHQKVLAKESLVTAIPSTSKLSEEHDQEDFGDTQCLPFKILGEGKHPQKESEFKLVEDVRSSVMKFETNPKPSLQSQASNPYVLEPKPSKIKEKKKKEKKEKKPDANAEEKEKRLLLGSGEMERRSSLRAEEKDSKYSPHAEEKHRRLFRHSPRAEEKHKQPFKHLRERLRHAFSINKEP